MTTNWTKYTGSDEQIAEIENNNVVFRYIGGRESIRAERKFDSYDRKYISHYWIIPDDPLREMKIRQAQTGQPVWVRYSKQSEYAALPITEVLTYSTTTPDWNIPNAEYSFTPWED